MTDFRITTTFFGHMKTLKLMRKLDAQICASAPYANGTNGVLCLLQLWAYAAENRRKGVLSGMNAEDIEAVSHWHGEAESFVQCLVDVGFLDVSDDGVFALHNWEDRNPWAFHADERSEAAKAAANARWGKSKKADGMRSALRKDAKGNADVCKEQCPFPSPIPSPKHKTLAQNCATFDAFWAAYPKKRSKGAAQKLWNRHKLGNGSFDAVMDGLQRAKTCDDWRKDGGKFIPYPATWLNDRGWEDEYTTTAGQSATDSSRVAFEDLPQTL